MTGLLEVCIHVKTWKDMDVIVLIAVVVSATVWKKSQGLEPIPEALNSITAPKSLNGMTVKAAQHVLLDVVNWKIVLP
jgi:hypothetical protein